MTLGDQPSFCFRVRLKPKKKDKQIQKERRGITQNLDDARDKDARDKDERST
uniref:Uncharacterized protein n=1 Tax=Rhizophora mucronata TaxID=61149 RepID=A0A2P2PNM0_RHIMU